MKEKKITAIILFAGEELVQAAIESVNFCDEIIIIHDCGSGEKNLKVLPQNISYLKILHKTLSSFSEQRNYGLANAKSEWVLFLDADEVISERLSKKITSEIGKNNADGYMIRRLDNFIGKTISKGELLNIYLLRLAKKNKGKWSGVVHETWRVQGKIKNISDPIYHNPHPTLYEFISEIDRYTTLRSSELQSARVNSNFFTIFTYTFLKFIWNYFFKFGFLEGNRGFVMSAMMSFHSFLARSKLYQSAHTTNPKEKN